MAFGEKDRYEGMMDEKVIAPDTNFKKLRLTKAVCHITAGSGMPACGFACCASGRMPSKQLYT